MGLSGHSCGRLTDFDITSQNVEKDKNSPASLEKYEQNPLEFNPGFIGTNGESSKYSPQFEETSSYSKFESNHEQNSITYVDRTSDIGASQSDLSLSSQTVKGEMTICQKPKEICSSGNSLITKFKRNPELLAKFISNPNLVAKIFQDQRVIMKIMTDPDMVTSLVTDPHVTLFLKENGMIDVTDERDCDNAMEAQSKILENNNVPGNMTRHTLKCKDNHVENPILTDLITNRNTEECKNQNVESAAGVDWNKNPADVTRDVLQDVQRYN